MIRVDLQLARHSFSDSWFICGSGFQIVLACSFPRRRNSVTFAWLPQADIEHHRRSPLREVSMK